MPEQPRNSMCYKAEGEGGLMDVAAGRPFFLSSPCKAHALEPRPAEHSLI